MGVYRGGARLGRLSIAGANCASQSPSYGGWDDPGLDSDRSGEDFRKFLSSIGIDDKRQVFVFVLGVLCAFAISRVRVSSIVVFPASVLVFAVGFSFGLFRGGFIGELNYGGNRKRSKEEPYRVNVEKFRDLVEIVDGFDSNVNNLKCKIQKAIDSREVTVSELEDCAKVLESIGLSATNVRDVIDVSSKNLGGSGTVVAENLKSNRRKKEERSGIGFDFLQSVGGLFKESVTDSKPVKVKSVETVEGTAENRIRNDDLILPVEEPRLNPLRSNGPKANNVLSQYPIDELSFDSNGERRVRNGGFGERFSDDGKEYGDRKNRVRGMNDYPTSMNAGRDNIQTENQKYRDSVRESVNFSIRMKQTETEASFVREQKLEKSDEIYRSSSHIRETSEVSSSNKSILGEETINVSGEIPDSSSSTVSDDPEFARCLTEAHDLLMKAKEFVRDGHEKERAEIVLYRCAKLLVKAVAMKPENLLAVGLLGNTYLLHGELKLRVSRELRTLLYRSSPSSARKWGTMRDQTSDRDDIASTLIDACEECEELLVEAGRKYRLALSIDENDVRALYNWGLALTFRAQLISDIGPEACFDADKVFLAAIDKFDAMMSKGRVYAPDALFRWGMVLQQRSRLRPSNSKEKVKLLNQAKSLFEDALDMNSNNSQVREALSTCLSELNTSLLVPGKKRPIDLRVEGERYRGD